MSKKKNKQKERPEIPVQDDPYWKVSRLFLDAHRVGRFMKKFEQFHEKYPEWTEALLDGLPTYYYVLGVQKDASEEAIEKAYKKKLELSYFSNDIVEEAYNVLTDKFLKKEYDELLFVFEQITKCMTPSEKNELIENHAENIKNEKDFIRMGEIQPQYAQYMRLHLFGAPELYELIGLDPKSSSEDISKKCETMSESFKEVCAILGDPSRRDDYDFLMHFVRKFGSKKHHDHRNRKAKKWERIDRKTIEKIIANSLGHTNGTEDIGKRMNDILSANQDWKLYIPPDKETFFSILGIDINSLKGDKKDIEKILREKYRQLEKTPQVNLAYSVLKNESQRADYLWLSENIDMVNAMNQIYSEEEEEKNVTLKNKKKQGAKKKLPPQITFEDIDRMIERIIEKQVNKQKS